MSAASLERIAVFDIGKTNAKLVVLDVASGAEIAARRIPNRVLPGPPYQHYDIDALWAFLLDSLQAFAKAPGFDAISITTHGASAVLLADDGGLALPVLDYEQEYPDEIRAAYDALRPDFIETFSPRLAMGLNVGAQLHYQKTAFPDAFARVATILTYPQYWAFRLTGIAANEVTSLGCHTDLWRPETSGYSALVDRLGIRDRMAPVHSAFEALGSLLPEIAADIGIAGGMPVHCGIHDSNASLLPHLIRREAPFSVVSTGTWVVSFAVGSPIAGLDPARDTLANVDAFGKPVPSARFMGGREFEMLTRDIDAPDPAEIEAVAPGVIARSLMVLPNVAEGSGPYPGHRMQWLGAPAGSAEHHAAASLYVAMMTHACLDLLHADGPIVVEGPFCRNDLYLRALASIAGRDVIVLADGAPTGTAQGAALLTGCKPPPGRDSRIAPFLDLEAYHRQWQQAIVAADTR